jgi:hypothetical protein
MQISIRTTLTLAAACLLQASLAIAAPRVEPTLLGFARTGAISAAPSLGRLTDPAPATFLLMQDDIPVPANVETSAVHYKPAPVQHYDSIPGTPFVTQLHGGIYDVDAELINPFDLGVRAGPMLDQRLQLGVAVDLIHQTHNIFNVISTTPGPGGLPVTVKQDSARALLNLIPMMGFVQVSGWGLLGFVPYAGLAGGYELLILSNDNFVTNESAEVHYGGWGWQAWGGVGFPLGKHTRLTGEVYMNQAELSKTLGESNGVSTRETVNLDGVGLRFGLAWGFRPPAPR